MFSSHLDMLPIPEMPSSSPTPPASPSAPVTPPESMSVSSSYSTPATSYFDSPTSYQCSPTHTSTTPSPIAPPNFENSSRERIQNWHGSKLHHQSEGKTSRNLPQTNVRSACDAMSDAASFHIFESSDELKLGSLMGSGQWSDVYSASLTGVQPKSQPYCDQQSLHEGKENLSPRDATRSSRSAGERDHEVLAVKVGSGKSNIKVLRSEAKFLSFLMERPFMRDHVVDFYGYDTQKEALVMENVPLTLEHFVASLDTSGRSVDDSAKLLKRITGLSKILIEGLAHIHEAKVIHGDIKPSNILLRRRSRSQDSGIGGMENQGGSIKDANFEKTREQEANDMDFQPIYCDFSASRFDEPDSIPSDSAGTYDFMAPELFSRSKPESYPTRASDTYALGVTLIYMVIGKSPYDAAQNVFMRRAMAMSGTPLQFINMDDQSALRWERARFEPWVGKAVQAKMSERWTAPEWSEWAEKRWTV